MPSEAIHVMIMSVRPFSFLLQPETECRMSIHDQVDENLILQIRLAALDDQRVNNSVTLEMLTQEKVRFYTS